MLTSSSSSPMSWSSNSEEGDVDYEKKEEEDVFLAKLKGLCIDRYLYQKDLFMEEQNLDVGEQRVRDFIFKLQARDFDKNMKLGYPIIQGINLHGNVKHYNYSELQKMTNYFSETSNLIRRTTHGRFFRATTEDYQDVIVKTWDFHFPPHPTCYFHTHRIHDELIFLRDPEIKSHPNVVKLIGYHCEKRLAVIYQLGIIPVHFLDQLQLSDEFKWDDRVRVAIEIGSMLKMFHDNKLVHGGVWPNSIMLDEQFRLMAFDFQLFNNLTCLSVYHKSPYCSDADRDKKDVEAYQNWSITDDVYTYGLLLMDLITKEKPYFYLRSNPPKSLVHESLELDKEIASKITELAIVCLEVKKNGEESEIDMGMVIDNLKSLPSITATANLHNLCEVISIFIKEAEV